MNFIMIQNLIHNESQFFLHQINYKIRIEKILVSFKIFNFYSMESLVLKLTKNHFFVDLCQLYLPENNLKYSKIYYNIKSLKKNFVIIQKLTNNSLNLNS